MSGALITRWLTWIRLFDFDVRHVPDHKYTAADGLSRRPRTQSDDEDEANEVDIDDFIDAELASISVLPIKARVAPELEDGYSLRSQMIAEWLTTLRRPIGSEHMTHREWFIFKREVTRFRVVDKHLFRENIKNVPLRRVIDFFEQRQEIIKILYDESGYKGIESIYRRIADRY